ncbi:hypothetical protein WICMUC_003500 [Wickerhamomyces mucosus]|uniref:PUM-HD domain-containing protein n=1 Tax=Wickerhamomyces mucosus TaxID=1378264 RepID=A0A9P8TCH3_9ASCO|nr:hypothetical protein WICMUC_003500 [Wickerhamomyces mucosus]
MSLNNKTVTDGEDPALKIENKDESELINLSTFNNLAIVDDVKSDAHKLDPSNPTPTPDLNAFQQHPQQPQLHPHPHPHPHPQAPHQQFIPNQFHGILPPVQRFHPHNHYLSAPPPPPLQHHPFFPDFGFNLHNENVNWNSNNDKPINEPFNHQFEENNVNVNDDLSIKLNKDESKRDSVNPNHNINNNIMLPPPPPPPQLWNGANNFENHFIPHHGHHNQFEQRNHRRFNKKFPQQRNKKFEDSSIFNNLTIQDFKGEILSLCKDQYGCRFLQKQIDINPLNADLIFSEILNNIVGLMSDPFGNYLIQKLIENLNDDNRLIFIEETYTHFTTIALNPHGTRSLQKLVDCVKYDTEIHLIETSLKNNILLLSQDLNGNHVIQKILVKFDYKNLDFIINEILDDCLSISTQKHGCCVLQRCLDNGSIEQCLKLCTVISNYLNELSIDPFGNYVLQYIINKNFIEINFKILTFVKLNFLRLSVHKFGSNVIERILKSSSEFSDDLINEILLSYSNDLIKLINDPFGNYVLQTCLDSCDSVQFKKFSNILKPLLSQIRNTPHGRRISIRLQQGILPSQNVNSKVDITAEPATELEEPKIENDLPKVISS